MDISYFTDMNDFSCKSPSAELLTSGPARIISIINSSKKRGDSIHVALQETFNADCNLTIRCHKNCVSTCTSTAHLDRYLKLHKQAASNGDVIPQKRRRSDVDKFNLLSHCIFCGMERITEKDNNNPSRFVSS